MWFKSLIMAALRSRCGHYSFVLWFLLLSSIFFSSPNLSRGRLDVYHTSTHGVALVRIYNAGLKCAARGSLEMPDPKNRHLGTFAQLCWAISLQLRHVSTIKKKLLSSNISSTCPHNMVNFGPLTAEISSGVSGHPGKFQQVSHLGSVTAWHSSSRHQPNLAALNRGRHQYSAERTSRWALAHISSISLCYVICIMHATIHIHTYISRNSENPLVGTASTCKQTVTWQVFKTWLLFESQFLLEDL